jgi:2-dehydropantoate 2-reductase
MSMSMHTMVVGGGALGSILAAHLGRSGERVTLVARGKRADHLERNGVTITGLEELHVPVTIARMASDVKDVDLLILATKTYDTASALAGIRLSRPPLAFSVQNGVQKNIDLANFFGADSVLGAAANFSGELRSDQVTAFTMHDALQLGELNGVVSERLSTVVALLSKAGIKARQVTDISAVEWSKYALYSSGMAPAVLTRAPTWQPTSDPDAAMIVAQIVREIGMLAKTQGTMLKDEGIFPAGSICSAGMTEAVEIVRKVGEFFRKNAPGHKVSALQDLERGRRLEADATLGFAVRLAAEKGLSVPTIETCYRLCMMLDRQAQLGGP